MDLTQLESAFGHLLSGYEILPDRTMGCMAGVHWPLTLRRDQYFVWFLHDVVQQGKKYHWLQSGIDCNE